MDGLSRKQHDKTVYTKPQTTGRRQPVFKGCDIVLVHLGIRALGAAERYLLLKALALIDRVVEFGEGVAHFLGIYKILKALSKGGIGGFTLSERRVFDRIVVDKRGLDQLVFYKRFEQCDEHVALCRRISHLPHPSREASARAASSDDQAS